MTTKHYSFFDIARCQFEMASRLYFEGEDYWSVITLAGAAEEILGRLAKDQGEESAVRARVSAYQDIMEVFHGQKIEEADAIKRLNWARNRAKHLDRSEVGKVDILIDTKEEAQSMLQRTLHNYCANGEILSPLMKRFENELYTA